MQVFFSLLSFSFFLYDLRVRMIFLSMYADASLHLVSDILVPAFGFFFLSRTETLVCILNNIECTLTKIRCLLRVICYKTCLSFFFSSLSNGSMIREGAPQSSIVFGIFKEEWKRTLVSPLSFFFLRLHLRRGNQIEYIYIEREKERRDGCLSCFCNCRDEMKWMNEWNVRSAY